MSETDFFKIDMHGEFTSDFNHHDKNGWGIKFKYVDESGLFCSFVWPHLEISSKSFGGNAATSKLCSSIGCLFPLFNRCRLEVAPNSKKDVPFDYASPFMGRLPLNDSLYTINGIIHDFIIKNEKFLFLLLGMCFEIIHNGPSMFWSAPNLL